MKAITKLAAALFATAAAASSFSQTMDGGYWNIYYYGDNPPSQGAAVEWAEYGLTPDDFTLAQVSQSGNTVTLRPNTHFCENALSGSDADRAYWCYTPETPGAGKWMIASSFDHTNVPIGEASTIDFNGCIVSNTLTEHSFTAFVKVFNNDYSQMWYEAYDSSGTFDLPATLAGDAEANVQVGFAVTGPTVHPDQIDDYGSVVVDLGATMCALNAPEAGDPNQIPTLPLGGLFGLIGLVAWLGLRRKS